MTSITITVEVNGKEHTTEIEARTLLLDYIRDSLGLTGAKRGCNEGKCGSCTLIMDGLTVKSCNVLAARAHGTRVETVEGLADGEVLHPIQQAFHEHHGLQCGFCTSGMLLTTKFLLEQGCSADHSEIREAIHGNICRCTGYQKIVEAIASVMERRQTMSPSTQGNKE